MHGYSIQKIFREVRGKINCALHLGKYIKHSMLLLIFITTIIISTKILIVQTELVSLVHICDKFNYVEIFSIIRINMKNLCEKFKNCGWIGL